MPAHAGCGRAPYTTSTLTDMYNLLEALHLCVQREARALTAKEKVIHKQGLVGARKKLHDELDDAVLGV